MLKLLRLTFYLTKNIYRRIAESEHQNSHVDTSISSFRVGKKQWQGCRKAVALNNGLIVVMFSRE